MKRAARRLLALWPLPVATSVHLGLLSVAMAVTFSAHVASVDSGGTVIPLAARQERRVDLERPRDVFERRGMPRSTAPTDEPTIFFPDAMESDHNDAVSGDSREFLSAMPGEGQGIRGRAPGVNVEMGVGAGGGGRYAGGTGGRRNLVARGSGAASEESSGGERYTHREDNEFHSAADQPLSTFSIDVDTASYSNVRRFLDIGQLPPADAVRIEEMLNSFRYADRPPEDGRPFAVHVESHPAPWAMKHRLVRIALRGRDVDFAQAPPANLVFLVDVSGSMADAKRLPLAKDALRLLAKRMRPQDKVSMVVYAGTSGLVLEAATGNEQEAIENAIGRLSAGGSTNGGAGIELAYKVAERNFVKGGINRVLLCTDGDWNVGVSNPTDLGVLIEAKRQTGVFLSVLGFGFGNYSDTTAQTLAEKGNGNAAYIDSIEEAQKVLVRQMTGTLMTIAKDVKIQVEFNATKVSGYRLIGYESRLLAAKDFNDDKKDAGEIGAGHQVTALYEVVPVGLDDGSVAVDPLKYRAAGDSPELLTAKVRFKQPDGETSDKIEVPFTESPDAEPSADFEFATAVAMSGMLLRGSEQKEGSNWGLVIELAKGAIGSDPNGERAEFVRLAEVASKLASKLARR